MTAFRLPPQVILFDLGGVLVDWDGIEPLVALCQGRLDREAARRFWLESPSVQRFETGRSEPGEFAAGAVEELGLSMPPGEFLEAFRSWERGPYPGAIQLLDELARRFRLACLSNNNPAHCSRLLEPGAIGRRFERLYLSYELGRFKPDPDLFRHVVVDLAVPADRILFLDDNPECVAGARACGLEAEVARRVAGVREVLARRGIELEAVAR